MYATAALLGDDHGVDRADRVADRAADTAAHVYLMLQVQVGDGVNRAEASATAAVDADRLVDVVVERSFHQRASLACGRFGRRLVEPREVATLGDEPCGIVGVFLLLARLELGK